MTSMADARHDHEQWVPKLGSLGGLSADRAALIRGLFELAAWIAGHSDVPVPVVRARFFAESCEYHVERALVDRLVVAFGNEPTYNGPGYYRVEASFGPIQALASFGPPEDYASGPVTETDADEATEADVPSGGAR